MVEGRLMGLIQGIVDDWFRKQHVERPSDGLLHPSSLSGCARQAVYEAADTPRTDERDVRSIRIMRMGTETHTIIQGALWESDLPELACEVPVEPDAYGMIGSAYAVWRHGEEGYEVIEIKSISPFALKRKGLPQPQHVEQARIYMWGLRQAPHTLPVTRARIVYVTRDDLEIRPEHEYIIPHDPDWDSDFESRVMLWDAMRGTTLLPPRIPTDSAMAWLCRYCAWQTRCWKVDTDKRRVVTIEDREDV